MLINKKKHSQVGHTANLDQTSCWPVVANNTEKQPNRRGRNKPNSGRRRNRSGCESRRRQENPWNPQNAGLNLIRENRTQNQKRIARLKPSLENQHTRRDNQISLPCPKSRNKHSSVPYVQIII